MLHRPPPQSGHSILTDDAVGNCISLVLPAISISSSRPPSPDPTPAPDNTTGRHEGSRRGRKPGPRLTPALLAAVRHLPIREAAARLGTSLTSLKADCRRLGVPRWPRAAPAPAAAGPGPGGGLGSLYGDGAGRGLSLAYARRVFRKHAAAEARRGPGPLGERAAALREKPMGGGAGADG
jgi:hypothetical protein